MAKTLPASFTEVPVSDIVGIGDAVLFDGNLGTRTLNRNHNRLLARQTKHHVTLSVQTGAAAAGVRGKRLRETAGAFVVRLEYRIMPRRHMPRLAFRVNAGCDAGGVSGEVRLTTPAATVTLTFTGTFAAASEQAATLLCTNTQPPTRQLVTVELRVTTATWIELRRLQIRDDYLALGDLP